MKKPLLFEPAGSTSLWAQMAPKAQPYFWSYMPILGESVFNTFMKMKSLFVMLLILGGISVLCVGTGSRTTSGEGNLSNAIELPPTVVCINEIDSDTPGTPDAAEYIELSGTPNGALDGFVVVLFNGANDLSYRTYDLDGYSLDANGFFLIGNSGVAGVDISINDNTIQNGADAVAIYDTAAFVILSFTTTINLVDAIVYDTDDAVDTELLTGLGQTVQYNENANGMVESQSISRSTNCGSSIVVQNLTPNATNSGSTCPNFSGAPPNVSIVNSTCNSNVVSGGSITAPGGTPCPAGSALQYNVNNTGWTTSIPTYNQTGPAQSIVTRCSCGSDGNNVSAESSPVTTIPADCTDNTPPIITCPANISVVNAEGQCSTIVNYATPVGSDNRPGATTLQTAGLPSGSVFPVGATTNCFTVTAANGQTANCCFTVTVTDTQLPTITCPGNIAVANDAGICGAVVNFATPVGTDNCLGAMTVQTLGLPAGSTYPVGATTNIFRVTAANGQTATCAFAVSVTDTQAPTISCPANISVVNAAGQCSAIVNYATPVGSDNCTGATTQQTAGLPSGSAFPVGTTTNCFTVTAANGQTANCCFTVTVTDTQAPTISCPANISVVNAAGQCSAIVN
nr:HYR domain-containing protein [Saprospiraceae bacterium]